MVIASQIVDEHRCCVTAVLIPGHPRDGAIENFHGRWTQVSEFLARFTANVFTAAGVIEKAHLIPSVVSVRRFCPWMSHTADSPFLIYKSQQLAFRKFA